MTVITVSTNDPMTKAHPNLYAVGKSNPIALSQIRWRMPPKVWYHNAQIDPSMINFPNQLRINPSAISKYSAEVDAASNHQITRNAPTISALPVIRTKMDVIDVNCGR